MLCSKNKITTFSTCRSISSREPHGQNVTQTCSTASSSMCCVSSISSSTSRNMSFRLSGPLSRASRRTSGSLVASSRRHDPNHTDSRSSMIIPVCFQPATASPLPPASCRLLSLWLSGAPWRTEDAQAANSWIRFFMWKVWGVAVCKIGSGSGLTARGGKGGRRCSRLWKKGDVVKRTNGAGDLGQMFYWNSVLCYWSPGTVSSQQ